MRKRPPKYEERKKSLVRDVPEKEVDEARQTQEYRDAYDWISGELGKVPKAQVTKACGDFLKASRINRLRALRSS